MLVLNKEHRRTRIALTSNPCIKDIYYLKAVQNLKATKTHIALMLKGANMHIDYN